MTPRRGVRLAALSVVVVGLLAPAAAHAEKVVTEDAVGDASSVTFVGEGGSEDTVITPAPDETATDITRTVVAHGNTRLALTVHLRDLVLTSGHETYVRVVTPQGQYQVSVGKNPGSRARSVLMTRRGRETECRGLRAAVDGGADTVAVSLPTSCIGSPRWVQVGVGVVRVVEPAEGADPATFAVFADDGHRDGEIRESDVAKGPKVRRG